MNAKAQVKYLFMMCNDVDAVIDFYGNILGLPANGGNEKGYAMINAGVDIAFLKGDYELPVHKEWAWQPGYNGGAANINSFSISTSVSDLREIYNRAKSKSSKMLFPKPDWRKDSYWAITLMDPMGNTI